VVAPRNQKWCLIYLKLYEKVKYMDGILTELYQEMMINQLIKTWSDKVISKA